MSSKTIAGFIYLLGYFVSVAMMLAMVAGLMGSGIGPIIVFIAADFFLFCLTFIYSIFVLQTGLTDSGPE
jgi:hypothetical protein